MKRQHIVNSTAAVLMAVLGFVFVFAVEGSLALGSPSSYSNVVFSDGFESGSLSAWDGKAGTGSGSVVTAAARSGAYGFRARNTTSGQSVQLVKRLSSPLVDSSTSFWVRLTSGSATQIIAQARDDAGTARMWDLAYDHSRGGFVLSAFKESKATEIFTGSRSVAVNAWVQVEVQYTATNGGGGGAQLYVDGQTKSAWRAAGDFTRTANFQMLQLWNDAIGTADFDDVRVARPPQPPIAPTDVAGVPGDRSVALSWSAPASDDGSAITGYRVTPYVGGTAQTSVSTGSAATSYTVTGLSNGTTYTFKVAAINAAGTGADSAASPPLTPVGPMPPGAPTDVVGSPKDKAVALTWTAPASDGGSPITGYRITPWIKDKAQPAVLTGSAATSYTVTGLSNSTTYTFTVAAINAIGTGPESAQSPPVRPAGPTTPGVPTEVTGAPGDRSVLLSWTAPASDGGSPITGYRITPWIRDKAQPAVLTGSAATSHTVTALTNGTTYTFTVAAINAVGTGPQSAASPAITPAAAAVPGAPTAVTGSPLDGAVALSWTAPLSDGGSAITGYQVTPYVGTTAETPILTGSSATSHTVTGLINGTAYTFRVAAINAVGTGLESAASAPVTPTSGAALPGAPTNVAGVSGNGAVSLTWTAPSLDGGSGITGYRVTPYAGPTAQTPILTGSAATSYRVTELTNGTAYTFRVAAINAVGTGPDSAASDPVTPVEPPPGQTVVSLTFDDGQITQYSMRDALHSRGMRATFYVNSGLMSDSPGWRMSWAQLQALAGDGHEITGHSLTHADLTRLDKDGQIREVCDDRQNLLARGFSPAASFAYPYGAYEQNDVKTTVQQCGYSSARIVGGIRSSLCPACPTAETIPPRDPLVLRTPPDIRNTATLATMQSYVTQAEQNGGGWVPLVFHYVCDNCDEFSVSQSQLTAFLDWLAPRAANGTVVKTIGEVTADLPPPPAATVPGAPTGVVGMPKDGAVALTWTAPASTGGSAITGYQVTPHVGPTAQAPILTGSTSASYTVTGLSNGTAYTFTIAAINAVGTGPESAASGAVTPAAPTVPAAPSGVNGSARDSAVTLTWAAPAFDGGSAISGYRVTPYVGGSPQTPVATRSTATSYTVGGLSNGTAYTFTVAAINAVGTSAESPASAPVTPVAAPPTPGLAPMPVISRGVPAHTNDSCADGYPASYANDSNYGTYWRSCLSAVSTTTPKWLAYDLSGVPAERRSTVVVAWYNDPVTGSYDHALINTPGYNNLGDYTIEVNPAPGGTVPTTGWSVAVSVTGNTFNSRQHVVDMSGDNWVRIHATASDGSAGNSDVAANVDVHDASGGVSDSWIFYGDSITQDGMLHDNRISALAATIGTFAQLVNASKPDYFPAFQNGGIGGVKSATGAAHVAQWLSLFPGRYVALAYGTNDALAQPGDPTIAGVFRGNMRTMIEAVLDAGKTPILPTIPWGRDAKLQANVPTLNAEIDRLLIEYPQALRGPDLYRLFFDNQSLIGSDGIHPTWDNGYAAFRQEWATFAATTYP